MDSPARNEKSLSSQSSVGDRDAAYRNYVADAILRYATKGGSVDLPEAYRQIMAATGRAIATVKNWLTYRANFPDLPSVARIVEHYKIPPETFFPPNLEQLLAGATLEPAPEPINPNDPPIISLYRPGDPVLVDKALARYTDHPRSAVFYRQSGSDMLDQVRPGELMLLDPTCEQITGSGMYLLRFSADGQPVKTAVRIVEVLMGEPAVRLSCGSAMPPSSVETIQLVQGALPSHVTVLARVIGVLRQL